MLIAGSLFPVILNRKAESIFIYSQVDNAPIRFWQSNALRGSQCPLPRRGSTPPGDATVPPATMTTLVPRGPYSQEELDRLYPKELKLQLVQIVSTITPT